MANQSTVSVPQGIVKKLKEQPGGINPIIDELRQKHRIHVNFDGSKLELEGRYDGILDIANEFLQFKVDRVSTTTKETFGGGGTVAWTYRGSPAEHIKHLFDAERKELLKVTSVKESQSNAGSLVLTCIYSDYATVKLLIDDLDKKIKLCKEKTVKVDAKDKQSAKLFVQTENIPNKYYSCLNVDKKDTNKIEIKFYGREEKDCKEVLSRWETSKQEKQILSSSKQPNNATDKGATGMSKTQKKYTTEVQNSNDTPLTMDSSWVDEKPVQEKNGSTKSMSTDTNEVPDVNSSSSGSFSSSTSQKNETSMSKTLKSTTYSKQCTMSCTAGASGGKGEAIQARASVYEVNKTPGKMTGTGETRKYTFQIEDIQFFVFKESITEIKGMDAITNAANEKLMHAGGVAYYISKAAGKKMDQDCRSYIEKNGHLPVTRNYVSVGGDIKCKGIIHAVGPTWYDYTDKREDCARDLYETIKNILIAGTSKKWQKVALSAISSGLFGVPKKLCAEMYIKAFADYATENVGGTVKEVYFIDVSREILDIVIDAHKTWISDESKLDFKNALEYDSAVSRKQTRKVGKEEQQQPLIQFLGNDKTTYGETRYKYRICKKLDVFVYQGSLTRLETVDAIVVAISPDPRERGALEGIVRSHAGPTYAKEVDKYRNGKNSKVFVCSDTGYLQCKHVVHVISPPVKRLDKGSLSTLSEAYCLALTHSYKTKIRSLGMPVFGAGAVIHWTDFQPLCFNVIQTLVSVCSANNKYMAIEELHLVNLDREVSLCLKEEFSKVTTGDYESGKKQTYKQSTYHSSNSLPSHDKDHHWMQHTPLEENKNAKTKQTSDRTSKGKDNQTNATKTIERAPGNGTCVYCGQKADIMLKECNHMYCPACAVPVQLNAVCLKCSRSSEEATEKVTNTQENCPICLEPLKKAETLPCSHKLCQLCYEAVKKEKPQCPVCQHIFGEVRGSQPDGNMFYRHVTWLQLSGYEGCGTIEILYDIPPGTQKKCHPHPGKPYKGIERHAYLPDNKEGQEILYLLRRAFDRKLVFTIGESRTTGKEGVVTWNDIHHKTRPSGGPDRFGYPDPTYLSRVREELAAKGVTE